MIFRKFFNVLVSNFCFRHFDNVLTSTFLLTEIPDTAPERGDGARTVRPGDEGDDGRRPIVVAPEILPTQLPDDEGDRLPFEEGGEKLGK